MLIIILAYLIFDRICNLFARLILLQNYYCQWGGISKYSEHTEVTLNQACQIILSKHLSWQISNDWLPSLPITWFSDFPRFPQISFQGLIIFYQLSNSHFTFVKFISKNFHLIILLMITCPILRTGAEYIK